MPFFLFSSIVVISDITETYFKNLCMSEILFCLVCIIDRGLNVFVKTKVFYVK